MTRWANRAWGLSVAGALALFVTGCADGKSLARSPVAAGVEAVPAAAQLPASAASPVLLFVASGRIGEAVSVSDPYFGGDVMVRLESEYTAASGRLCRRFGLAPRGQSEAGQVFYACQSDGAWALAGLY